MPSLNMEDIDTGRCEQLCPFNNYFCFGLHLEAVFRDYFWLLEITTPGKGWGTIGYIRDLILIICLQGKCNVFSYLEQLTFIESVLYSRNLAYAISVNSHRVGLQSLSEDHIQRILMRMQWEWMLHYFILKFRHDSSRQVTQLS